MNATGWIELAALALVEAILLYAWHPVRRFKAMLFGRRIRSAIKGDGDDE